MASPSIDHGIQVLRLRGAMPELVRMQAAELDAKQRAEIDSSGNVELELRWHDDDEDAAPTLPRSRLLQQVQKHACVTRSTGGAWPPNHATAFLVVVHSVSGRLYNIYAEEEMRNEFGLDLQLDEEEEEEEEGGVQD